MNIDHHAAAHPSKNAVVLAAPEGGTDVVVTWADLAERSRRFANLLRAQGLGPGDHIAIMLENRAEVFEIAWGAMRAGVYFTFVNWHLQTDEAIYIVNDSSSSAFVTSEVLAKKLPIPRSAIPGAKLCLAVGGTNAPSLAGYTAYEPALTAAPDTAPEREHEGQSMLYSSGTTGRPKGIKRPLRDEPFGTPNRNDLRLRDVYGWDERVVFLCPGPLYHAAPLGWAMGAQRLGGTAVVMPNFDALETLRLIERHRISHSFMVPTYFVRMLKLTDKERRRYSLSSLEFVIHAAAPCPVEVKKRMLDWWGPLIHEFYSSTEGISYTTIGPKEWLAKPGSVGRLVEGKTFIVGEDGTDQPAGREGVIWYEGVATFSYHNDPKKTADSHDASGRSTVGDVGYVDEDGYLFLTDRKSHMIISGGVNIYPQELENLLTVHPSVKDVAVIGVPHEEMGEEVIGVVVAADPRSAGPVLAEELIAYARANLAHYKCPRRIDFVDALPRSEAGKMQKRLIRDRYWQGMGRRL